MAGRGSNLGLVAAVNDLCGLSCLHGNDGRVNLCDYSLLGSEAAADPGLDHTDL